MSARDLLRRPAPYRIAAYSEFMPAPRIGVKACGEIDEGIFGSGREWLVSEREEEQELRPGLQRIGEQLIDVLQKLGRGERAQGIDGRKLDGNPAWPDVLRDNGAPKHERYVLLMPLALSRTQDDKGRIRWTLFGASEHGPERAFKNADQGFFERLVHDVYGEAIKNYLVTFTPFARLPKKTQDAYLRGDLHLIPFPGSLLFFHAPGYHKLQRELPRALQIPLLYSIDRHEHPRGIRVTQSGWMNEHENTDSPHGPFRNSMRRTNRWTKVHRHEDELEVLTLTQKVTHSLFSAEPQDLGLYGKPMARNAQIWTDDYRLLLDGPNATREEVQRAARSVDAGGHFGYRFFYPPMRVGETEVYWHRPLVAWSSVLGPRSSVAPLGYVEAGDIELTPRIVKSTQSSVSSKAAHDPVTFPATSKRSFETNYWKTIARLAHGSYINKDNADVVLDAATQRRLKHKHNDLERLGDYLLSYYRRLGVRATSDRFTWDTDFDFTWSEGWLKAKQRNIIAKIPGRDRRAVIMADHYDTAYMENVFGHSGHGPRIAAPGADDNHSATAALMLAAPIFLELSRKKKLAHDIWLVHLTGEEFPSDCLGARHLCERIVEEKLDVEAVFVLDMVAHNNRKARDIFQICPGEGRASLSLAQTAKSVNAAWNEFASTANQRGPRAKARRGKRSRDPRVVPPLAKHLILDGDVRPEDHPHSTLYNTDGQIFSDTGVPVVLFMENYDINRHGYHDSHDTMENIDLDYGAALVAIAIETVAATAMSSSR